MQPRPNAGKLRKDPLKVHLASLACHHPAIFAAMNSSQDAPRSRSRTTLRVSARLIGTVAMSMMAAQGLLAQPAAKATTKVAAAAGAPGKRGTTPAAEKVVVKPHPTFAEDVAPILYKNCTGCHHVGGVGPFPLFEYDSAKAYVDELREKISLNQMPPWHATGARGVFSNDRRITESQRQTILRWLDDGAKPGDLKKLPPRPDYPLDWSIGTPDAVISMPTDFEVPASGTIDYQHFDVPSNFKEDKWIQAYEILPGSRDVVHHVLVYAKTPPDPPGTPWVMSPIARNRIQDPLAPEPKKTLLTYIASFFPQKKKDEGYGTLIASLAPGTNPIVFPAGTALRVKAGTTFSFTMHYTAHGHVMKDRTRIGFRFAKAPPDEEIISSQFVNEIFTLPAGKKNIEVPAEISLREPVRIWGLLPHTHLRGTRWLYTMTTVEGKVDTVLNIPNYDFNWQTYYLFKTPLEVPKGAKLNAVAWYDNSSDNKDNPNPKIDVKPGKQTWEEMQYTGFLYSVPSRNKKSSVAATPTPATPAPNSSPATPAPKRTAAKSR